MIKKYSKVLIVLLLLIEFTFVFLSIKSFNNKDITKIKEENKVNKEMFSMYVENKDGEYEEYTDGSLFAIEGYELNLEKSNCVDTKGNIVNDVLSSSNNKVTISSNKTSYCYMYFDIARYNVNISSNDETTGTVTPTSQIITHGNSATITVTPTTGYEYSSNTCGGTVSGNTMTISNVTSDTACLVRFEKIKYIVAVSSTNTTYGTVTPTSQSISYESNATITLNPTIGYKYSSNTCGGTVSGNTMTISNITAAKTCTVTFEKMSIEDCEGEIGECLIQAPTTGLNTNIEAGMYRYQGNSLNNDVINNYICFGTNNKSNCTSNTDAYMYRIIGIKSDGQIKLIKKEALNSTVFWYNSVNTNIDVKWPNSLIYKTINGNEFLLNKTYIPTGWENKIATTTWKYGDATNGDNYNGPTIYATENGWTTTVSAKIGLWYIHDYYYAYASGGAPGSLNNASTSWIHLSKNDTSAPSTTFEWTMSRAGYSGGTYNAWRVNSNGGLYKSTLYNSFSVRPVFYLNSTVEYVSGTGSSTDPFLIN